MNYAFFLIFYRVIDREIVHVICHVIVIAAFCGFYFAIFGLDLNFGRVSDHDLCFDRVFGRDLNCDRAVDRDLNREIFSSCDFFYFDVATIVKNLTMKIAILAYF